MNKILKRCLVVTLLLPALLLASCRLLPPLARPSASPDAPASYEVVAGYAIKTDYAGLTSYKPADEKYTRLSEGPLPILQPSEDYGLLLPYVGEVLYSDSGYSMSSLYGLVTADGRIVTDAVYTGAWQGHYYNTGSNTGEYMPAYHLQQLGDSLDESEPWNSGRHAACALDGSWITPFDYSDIWFTDTVILLVRDYDTNDVDVMDYDGRLLYNSKALSCYEDILPQSAYMFQSCYGEGCYTLQLSGGRTVYIDAVTGSAQITDFEYGGPFSNGLSAVMKNGLYGYVDSSLRLVIPLQYVSAEYFYDGKSSVQDQNGTYAIIDQNGTPLMTARYYISRYHGFYAVFDNNQNTRYYSADFNEITLDDQQLSPLDDGWFSYKTDAGLCMYNVNDGKSLTVPDIDGVGYIRGGLASVYVETPNWQEGLISLDGKMLIPPAEYQSISIAASDLTGETYAVAAVYDVTGRGSAFKVYDAEGRMLFEGIGYANYMTQLDLFQIQSDDSCAYADLSGKELFRISLLDYVPD
jgi:hypothetical protein